MPGTTGFGVGAGVGSGVGGVTVCPAVLKPSSLPGAGVAGSVIVGVSGRGLATGLGVGVGNRD